MDLLTNAVESLQAGAEDFATATRPRLLSAIRNIHAGILLLYKEALRRRSPLGSNEAFVKAKYVARVDNAGNVTLHGVGKKTADVQQIRERFEVLGISTDWVLFKDVADARNNVEHYYPNLSKEALGAVIARAFTIARRFIKDELRAQPRELLGVETWDRLLSVATIYQEERQECDNALNEVMWLSDTLEQGVRSVRCENCGSDLLKPNGDPSDLAGLIYECRACGSTKEGTDFAEQAIAAAVEWDEYVAMTDGGEYPFADCPECGTVTFVVAEDRCVLCDQSFHRDCDRCGSSIPLSEMACAPYCGYCEHVMSKDD